MGWATFWVTFADHWATFLQKHLVTLEEQKKVNTFLKQRRCRTPKVSDTGKKQSGLPDISW
jgi:hypothetical protein